jgi:lauroyl/myristoyl acyltransferase
VSNLEAAFGDELSIHARRRIVRQSYQSFARSMIDLFWTPRLTKENFSRYIEIENLERFHHGIGPNNAAIAASIHYGNFEWLSLALGFIGYPAEVVTQGFKNPLLDSIFEKVRKHFGHNVGPRKGAIVRLYKTLRRGGRAAILVDLWLHPKQPSVVIDCFGLKTCVTMAHAWLHEKTGAPILPTHCVPLPDGRYRVVWDPKIEIPPGASYEQIAQACWDVFEPIVRQDPAPWLWMYKHWRYKPAQTDRGYPFYAHASRRFEGLVERSAAMATLEARPRGGEG